MDRRHQNQKLKRPTNIINSPGNIFDLLDGVRTNRRPHVKHKIYGHLQANVQNIPGQIILRHPCH